MAVRAMQKMRGVRLGLVRLNAKTILAQSCWSPTQSGGLGFVHRRCDVPMWGNLAFVGLLPVYLMITEEELRKDILGLRRDQHMVAFTVAVGDEDRLLLGTMLAGVSVTEWPSPMPAGCYCLVGVPVAEPGLACAELGAE